MTELARVALVGDRSPTVRAHARIPSILAALRDREGVNLDAYWVSTMDAEVGGFDGVWLLPGSPYRSQEGAVDAARRAREGGVPFLGTCGGFQHALLEYARNVCDLAGAEHAEYAVSGHSAPSVDGSAPSGADVGTASGGVDDGTASSGAAVPPLIVPLACSLVGHEGAIHVAPDTLAARILGTGRRVERYHCSYGANPVHLAALAAGGLRFTGHDDAGDVRVAELPDHPFFLATLFQPELSDDGDRPHPVIRAFAAAAVARAASRVAA